MKRLTNRDPDVVIVTGFWWQCPHCFLRQLHITIQIHLCVNRKAGTNDASSLLGGNSLLDILVNDGIQKPSRKFRQLFNPLKPLAFCGVVPISLWVQTHQHTLVPFPQNLEFFFASFCVPGVLVTDKMLVFFPIQTIKFTFAPFFTAANSQRWW